MTRSENWMRCLGWCDLIAEEAMGIPCDATAIRHEHYCWLAGRVAADFRAGLARVAGGTA